MSMTMERRVGAALFVLGAKCMAAIHFVEPNGVVAEEIVLFAWRSYSSAGKLPQSFRVVDDEILQADIFWNTTAY